MKLIISGKEFTAKFSKRGGLEIPLTQQSDLNFFREWQDLRKSTP